MNEHFHLSFELFPPKTPPGLEHACNTVKMLDIYEPNLFTMTFGAGGSDREKTLETIQAVQPLTQSPIAAHISCIGATKASIRALLKSYQANKITQLVVLRGDLPDGSSLTGDFKFASDLIEFIRTEMNDTFAIHVAGYPEYHPESSSPEEDFKHLCNKIKAGANGVFTQYFYNPDAYFELVDNLLDAGLDITVIPGIMPITNYKQLKRFSDMCGAQIPQWIEKKLAYYDAKDDMVSLRAFGEHAVTMLTKTLCNNGAMGAHFYTLNKHEPVQAIIAGLADA
jgi:methylenetetrahydrofolate reductase (NADPH)